MSTGAFKGYAAKCIPQKVAPAKSPPRLGTRTTSALSRIIKPLGAELIGPLKVRVNTLIGAEQKELVDAMAPGLTSEKRLSSLTEARTDKKELKAAEKRLAAVQREDS
jgi:hypothetical protein